MIDSLLCLLAGSVGLFHALTSLLWLYEQRVHGPARTDTGLVPGLTAWLGEGLAILLAVGTWPFGFWTPRVGASVGKDPPVVLVPGWMLNRGSLALLEARLRRDGREAYAINYPSAAADPDRMTAALAAAFRSVAERTGAPVLDVVAHGQGGVLVRAAVRDHGLDHMLARFVTLGSPHQGAALAALVRAARFRHLQPGGPFVERLRERDTLPEHCTVAAIHSLSDTIVFPPDLAHYAGVMNITIDDVGHMGMLFSERVYRLVRENLDAPRRDGSQRAAEPA